MKSIATVLPLTYAIRDVRAVALANATLLDILPDLQKLAIFALVMPLLGWLTFFFTERRARQSGTLGQH